MDTGPENAKEWLVLTHQVPPEPPYLRVRVRRQLERIGAIPLKNAVYVLPPGEDTREDFEWLAREIERNGGETTLSLASFLDETTDARLVAAFREARGADYRSIADAARELCAKHEEEPMSIDRRAMRSGESKLRRRLSTAVATDFFDAPGREEAERAIADLESLSRPGRRKDGDDTTAERPAGQTWVTREGPKVDRMASAWLVRRFIDPAARFKFVPARGYASRPGEIRFDMFDGEFTHEGDRCTFETLLARFGLDDPGLTAVAEIVHDIDCKDDKFGRAEVSGVASLVDGIVRVGASDEDRLARGATLFDSLYEHLRSR